jgi:hypothetical protein
LVGLTGCSSSGVTIPPGSDRLRPCPEERIDVQSLPGAGAPSCNWEGSTLAFPGGRTMRVSAVGVNSSSASTADSGVEVRSVNWGLPGVAAVLIEDGQLQVWGHTRSAVELQLEQLSKDGIEPSLKE